MKSTDEVLLKVSRVEADAFRSADGEVLDGGQGDGTGGWDRGMGRPSSVHLGRRYTTR